MSVSGTPIKLVPAEAKNTEKDQVYMSADLLNQLKIDARQSLRICFGKKFVTVKVRTAELFPNEYRLSENILEEFSLPVNTCLFLCIPAKQTLYLGPVIALLTDIEVNEHAEPSFRSIHSFCGELNSIVSEMGGFFYVFSYSDFSTEEITGYYFDKGKWLKGKLPFPDCIYNRIHSRKVEQSPLFKKFRQELEQSNILLFNDHYFSKWEIYQYLIENKQILPYLPETEIFSKKNLKELMEKYPTVFIKPDHGSNGRNILKLVQDQGEDQVTLHASQNPGTQIQFRNDSISALFEHLRPFLQNRMYIIQQGISLVKYQKGLMDFRVLVHRKEQNLWKVTSLVARISAEQQFVSNLAQGGTIMKPYPALSASFNKQTVSEIIALLRELSLEAAATVSQNTSGIQGELGIDIGIDQTGKPWIIEINTKPSKNFEGHLKVRPSAKAIIQYCVWLFLEKVLEKELKT